MPKRRKRRNRSGLWLLFALGLALVAGLAYYVKRTPADKVPWEWSRQAQSPAPTVSQPSPQGVKVLTPQYQDDKLTFREAHVKPPPGEDPRSFAVNSYLAASKIAPSRARVLSVEVKAGVAYLNFNPAFQQTYGTEDERTLLEGILRAMGQFPEVREVGFQIEGQPLDTIGNIDLSSPLPVIRSSAKPASGPGSPEQG